jgi:hypothetical protein
MSRGARLAAWSAFLVLTLRLLHGPAFGHLSMPLDSLDELAAWADRTAPSAMALAVVRLAAIAAAWYLTGATVLAVAADLAGLRRTALVVAALSPAIVRRLASRSAGVGLAAGALLAVTPMPTRLAATPANASTRQSDAPQPPTATMTRHPHTPPTVTGTGTGTPQAGATALPTAVTPPSDSAVPTMTRLAGAQPAGTIPANASARPADVARPGVHAAPTMTRQFGTPPTGTTQPNAPAPTASPRRLGTLPGNSAAPTMTRLPAAQPASSTPSGTTAPPVDLALAGDHASPTMTRVPGPPLPGASAPATMPGHPGPQPEGATPPAMTRLAAASAAPATPTTATMARLPGEHPTATRAGGGPAERWPVAQGDSFWSIAHEALTDHLGHRPTDDDVSRYWRHLIAANRHRLLDPANCDLLVPGQQLELPPPA